MAFFRGFAILGLSTILAFLIASRANADGMLSAQCVISGASDGIVQLTSPLAGKPVLPHFRKGRKGGFPDGAIYDSNGNVMCVLPHDPKAYVLKPEIETAHPASMAAGLEAYCEAARNGEASADLVPLTLSNNDLLRRLIWLVAEGGCFPISRACVSGKDCTQPSPEEYGSRYYAYVIKNLRTSFPAAKDDDSMLRTTTVDSSGSLYDSYFVKGDGNSRTIFSVAHDPNSWVRQPIDGTGDCKADLCWTQRAAGRCMKDLIAADLDHENAHSPLLQSADNWVGSMTVPKQVCGAGMQGVVVRIWNGHESRHCFKKFKAN